MVINLIKYSLKGVLIGLSGFNGMLYASSITFKPEVAVTHPLLADWVQAISGDALHVINSMPMSADPHTFDPPPQALIKISKADVVISIGLNLDPWAQHLYNAASDKSKYIFISTLVALDETTDPHIWMDPKKVILIIEKLKEKLIERYPQFEDTFNRNASVYIEHLKGLDKWIQQAVSVIPKGKRALVTYHNSFSHFANAYGFKIVGTVIDSSNTDVPDPSAYYFLNLIKKIKAEQVAMIFGEVNHNQKLTIALSKQARLPPPEWLYTDTLDATIDTYIKMMQYDTQTIVNGLTNGHTSL